ncbi:MAG: phosphoribosylformylglycinamidine synthase subunit PurQ [Planctomycetota bacterium]
MSAPRAIVVKAPGTNCELESRDALRVAGAEADIVTTAELYREPERLLAARILLLPGGFAHGDDVASARILANQMATRLGDVLRRFVDDEEGLVLGICNGFQALVKLGLLPRAPGEPLRQRVSLVHNASGRYECRWVRLRVEDGPCRFLPRGTTLEMPVGHGEGKLVFAEDWGAAGSVALRYVDADGRATDGYPANPNGSLDAIAGLTDATGRVLGLMPHPDRSYLPWHHPRHHPEPGGAVLFRHLVETAR